MSLDLQLLPFECDFPTIAYSHSILNCPSNFYKLYDILQEEIENFKLDTPNNAYYITGDKDPVAGYVPDDFTSYLSRDDKYEEPHYGVTTHDPYGSKLVWVKVKVLMQFKDIANENPKTKAVWTYLNTLELNTKVALFWC